MRQFALPWLILDITGSLTQLGFVVFLQGLSMSLVALVGGILADRYDRRSLLIWSQAFTFLVFFALATLAVTGKIELWQIYGASFIGGGSLSISMPARQALIRSLVPRDQIMNAVALNSLQMTSSMIIWPSVAGFMIQFIGMGSTLYANAACLVIGIWGILMMGQVRDDELDQSPPRFHRMLIEGLRYTKDTPVIFGVMTLGLAIAILGMPYLSLAPGFGREIFGMGASHAGLLMMVGGVGSIIGTVALASHPIQNQNRLFVALGFLLSFSLIAFAANPWYYAVYAIMLVVGLAGSMIAVVGNSIMITVVPSKMLGRVVSVWSFSGGFIFMAGLPIGLIGEIYSLRWALGGAAFILLIFLVLLGLLWAPLRKPFAEVTNQ